MFQHVVGVGRTTSPKALRIVSSRLRLPLNLSFIPRSVSISSGVRGQRKSSVFSQAVKNEPLERKKGEDIVWNPCGVQMISDDLYQQIFIDSYRQRSFQPELVDKCKRHLEAHSLWGQQVKPIPSVDFTLPVLEGENINDHFRNIALQQTFKYKKLMSSIAESEIPLKPSQWKFIEGWTKYLEDGTSMAVPYPEEDAIIFDVEVCVTLGHAPTLACALTPKHWYSWCSGTLVQESHSGCQSKELSLDELIPFETDFGDSDASKSHRKEKIIIGHNVCYDRARIKEQYFLKNSKTRFMDTMSLHIAISGITSYQRALKLTAKAGAKNVDMSQLRKMGIESNFLEWNDQSSLNNLADVYKLYCKQELSKSSRDVFVKGTMDDIRKDFQDLMSYCANDVGATKNLFGELLPLFYDRFPHPVTLAGMLEMGSTYLPINSNWNRYIENSERTFGECELEVKSILMKKADEALALLEGEKFKTDPWLWDMDWKVPKIRKSKSSSSSQDTPARPMPMWYRKLLYKETDPEYMPGPAKISTSMQMVPKILRLTWFGFPLHYSRKGGWGFLVKAPESEDQNMDMTEEEAIMPIMDEEESCPEDSSGFPYDEWLKVWDRAKENLLKTKFVKAEGTETLADLASANLRNKSEQSAEELEDFIRGLQSLTAQGLWAKGKRKKLSGTQIECSPHPKCIFIALPHKDGPSNRVGNPLAKDFLSKIEEGVLTSSDDDSVANKVVRLSKMSSYWKNNRDRIMGQISVWHKPTEVNESEKSDGLEYGAILPQVAVSGTLTRRAVEPTWMTASNAYEDRIGSELKGLIQTPPGYHFVGADVDSQELWIASIIGDASFTGIHGSTALGWMTLQGSKSAGTDMHSKTASLIGIGRDQAKILNYGRIYGAGVNFAERLLTQFNKQLKATDARQKAKTMYKMTKGERKYMLNEFGKQICEAFEDFREKKDEPFSRTELRTLLYHQEIPFPNYMELVDKLVWDGGTESQMFNRLEEIAQQECPRTPFLECCISRSLVPSVVHNDFMTSRVNWVVQSSAVDYLHLMLTCMQWLIEKYDIDARFAISVHDEVRYIVKTEDRYRAALALQISNLLTRSAFSYQIGMVDLPMSVAYFSCVDIDKVLRKEVTHDCKTPSNLKGLTVGYGVPLGEGIEITDLLQLTNGSLHKTG